MDYPRIINAGDSAVVIEFENKIEPEINAKVKTMYELVKASAIQGVVDLIPTYNSLLVQYDPMVIRYATIMDKLSPLLGQASDSESGKKKIYKIPVCYGGEFAPDLKDLAEYTGLSEEEVISIHAGTPYLIYMLGFQPGFAYLGGMDERIAMPRLEKPRTKIMAGSVGIANSQTGIYPLESPAGWRLIGATPVKIYDPDREVPILYEAGDYIEFVPIDMQEYLRIKEEVQKGSYVCPVVLEN